jgi:carbonic anhydrase/acetyltransferase-like protein (isoleucine patch superfamily)
MMLDSFKCCVLYYTIINISMYYDTHDTVPLTRVGHLAIIYTGSRVHADAVVGDRCTVHPHAEVKQGAILGEGRYVGDEAVVGRVSFPTTASS